MTVGIVAACAIVLRARPCVVHTTLKTAWGWAIVAGIAWLLTWVLDQHVKIFSPPLADYAWYLCALLGLCPPMAVLGSRRPGIRVWMWFILFPMLLVLGWPIIAVRLQGSEWREVQLELPHVCAVVLVLVMSVGNYLGTRFTLTAFTYGLAILMIVVSMSVMAPDWLPNRQSVRIGCSGLMVFSIWMTKAFPRSKPNSRFDRLWFDFFDYFGVVWGRRIQDRVNHIAEKENWPFRLNLEGMTIHAGGTIPIAPIAATLSNTPQPQRARLPPSQVEVDSEQRLEVTLRWLLRRFVDSSWIDDRIGPSRTVPYRQPEVDS